MTHSTGPGPGTDTALLVVAGRDIPTLPRVIDGLRRHAGCRDFHIVCPPDAMAAAQQQLSGIGGVRVVDEEAVIPGLGSSALLEQLPDDLPGGRTRRMACWYYQQFLKMGFARFAPDTGHYLVWDADTLPLRPLSFFRDGRLLLTTSTEYHRDYFRTIARLLPGVAIPRTSHISQHALVNCADMRALLDELSAPGQPWWHRVLRVMTGRSPQQFSEYETYAAYCLARWPQRYQSVHRRWLRRGSSYFRSGMTMADTGSLAGLYDFVSFEDWDTGDRQRRRARYRVLRDRVADWCELRVFRARREP